MSAICGLANTGIYGLWIPRAPGDVSGAWVKGVVGYYHPVRRTLKDRQTNGESFVGEAIREFQVSIELDAAGDPVARLVP